MKPTLLFTRPRRMAPWAALLARSFNLDMTRCQKCGGRMKVISQIRDRAVIDKILAHIGHSLDPPERPQGKLPYQALLIS